MDGWMDGLDIFDYIYIYMLLPQICRMKLYVEQKCVEAVHVCCSGFFSQSWEPLPFAMCPWAAKKTWR